MSELLLNVDVLVFAGLVSAAASRAAVRAESDLAASTPCPADTVRLRPQHLLSKVCYHVWMLRR